MTATPGLLWARASILGTVALVSGLVSHVAGGGLLPGVPSLLVLLGLAVLGSVAFLRTRVGALMLGALVVAGQGLVHLALSLLAGHASSPSSGVGASTPATTVVPPTGGTGLRAHYEATAAQVAASGDGGTAGSGLVAHQVDHLTAQGLWMVLTHLLAAAGLGWFLAVGETALWRRLHLVVARALVQGALRGRTALAGAVARGIACSAARLPERPLLVLTPQVIAHPVVRRRGPPRLLAA